MNNLFSQLLPSRPPQTKPLWVSQILCRYPEITALSPERDDQWRKWLERERAVTKPRLREAAFGTSSNQDPVPNLPIHIQAWALTVLLLPSQDLCPFTWPGGSWKTLPGESAHGGVSWVRWSHIRGELHKLAADLCVEALKHLSFTQESKQLRANVSSSYNKTLIQILSCAQDESFAEYVFCGMQDNWSDLVFNARNVGEFWKRRADSILKDRVVAAMDAQKKPFRNGAPLKYYIDLLIAASWPLKKHGQPYFSRQLLLDQCMWALDQARHYTTAWESRELFASAMEALDEIINFLIGE